MLLPAGIGVAVKASDWASEGVPIIRIQNLNNPKAPFNFYQGEILDRFSVMPGDLLFAWSGTPGTSFGAHIWRGMPAILNQHIFKLTVHADLIDYEFLCFALNNKLDELIGHARGGVGLRHVTKGKFENTLIELPPLPEQRRIAAALTTSFDTLEA